MAQHLPVILCAFANNRDRDGDQHLAALPNERDQIEAALDNPEVCELKILPDATDKRILDTFQSRRFRGRISVLHFGGHAAPSFLFLETPAGGVVALKAKSLAAFLATQPELALVFINGCNSIALARELLEQGVSAVIGTTEAVEDHRAAHFATVFYRALADGLSLKQAFQETEAAPVGHPLKDGKCPSFSFDDEEQTWTASPWRLETRPGEEHRLQWRLQDYDPLSRLPLPRDLALPAEPFHLTLLQGYERQHARAFLGRGETIRQLYDALANTEAQLIQLFYGQSGVGKSSLLAAGLLPRLETSHAIAYLRRPPHTGLLAALIEIIGDGATLAEAWRGREAQEDKPLLIVLDQVEDLLQSPTPGQDEWQTLLAALESLLHTPAQWPRGKFLLVLRKEWLAEVDASLSHHRLPFEKIPFLKRLSGEDIREILQGAASLYGLRFNPSNLPERIAVDLQADPESPVAPTLQILLSHLWQEATGKDWDAPYFDETQYENLKRQGLHLENFLNCKLEEMRQQHPAWERNGFGLEILNEHTTDLGLAAKCSEAELHARFPHFTQVLPEILAYFKNQFLLAEVDKQERDIGPATRLVHDNLAPFVRRKWRLVKSNSRNRTIDGGTQESISKHKEWDILLAETLEEAIAAQVGYISPDDGFHDEVERIDTQLREAGVVPCKPWRRGFNTFFNDAQGYNVERQAIEVLSEMSAKFGALDIVVDLPVIVLGATSVFYLLKSKLEEYRTKGLNHKISITIRAYYPHGLDMLGRAKIDWGQTIKAPDIVVMGDAPSMKMVEKAMGGYKVRFPMPPCEQRILVRNLFDNRTCSLRPIYFLAKPDSTPSTLYVHAKRYDPSITPFSLQFWPLYRPASRKLVDMA